MKPEKRNRETAAKLIARLQTDPGWVRQNAEREEKRKALEQELATAELPLVEALNDAGVLVKSVWDLVNSKRAYGAAMPVLIKHLRHPYPFRIREGIARALTVKDAGEAAYAELVAEFKKLSDSTDAAQHGFKWALGNAISIVASKDHFSDIVKIIRDKRHGKTRDMMTLRLPNLDSPRAVDVLIEALADDEIAGHAAMGLGKLESQKARTHLKHVLAHHPQPWVRKEALKALTKLNK